MAAEMLDLGFEGYEFAEPCLKAYIAEERFVDAHLRILLDARRDCGVAFSYTVSYFEEKNWNEDWESRLEPLLIGAQVSLRAPYHKDYPRARYNLVIEPDMAFGTGHHPTTFMMIEALLSLPVAGKRVMDLGCGTGVLAILAARMGAAIPVHAADIDRRAVGSAFGNARRNRVGKKIFVLYGDAAAMQARSYDIVLSNINRNTLLDEMPTLERALDAGGLLLLSGFFVQDIPKVRQAAETCGLRFVRQTEREGWALMLLEK